MATCTAALLRCARRSVGLGDAWSRGGHRQEQVVGPVPPPLRRRVADLASHHRPVLSLHGPLREGKTLRKRRDLAPTRSRLAAAAPGTRRAPGGPLGSGRTYGL